MVVKVLTYETADQLINGHSQFSEYKDILHIVATGTLKTGVLESAISDGWVQAPILQFGKLGRHIGENWFLPKTNFYQYATLSEILREYASKHKNIDKRIFNAIFKNQDVILKTLRSLTEAGLTSREVFNRTQSNLSLEESICMDIWSDLEEHYTFKNLECWFSDFNREPISYFEEAVRKTLLETYNEIIQNKEAVYLDDEMYLATNLKVLPTSTIESTIEQVLNHTFKKRKLLVLHGFYFITPLQKRVFDKLGELMDIVYLIQYDQHYPNVFETVTTFLPPNQYPYERVSTSTARVTEVANRFANMIEGKFYNQQLTESMLLEFNHLYQFKYYAANQPEEVIFSPRAQVVRPYLENIDSTSNRSLKDYPIGQFLLDVHAINTSRYDEKRGEVDDEEELNTDLLTRIFNSGYLFINNVSARKYVADLEKLERILKECNSLDSYREKIQWLIQKKQLIENTLDGHLNSVNEKDIDHIMYTYWNRNLAYYNISFETLEEILAGLCHIQNLYNQLYTGDKISINDYVQKLNEHVHDYILDHLDEEEQKIAQQVLESLDDLKDDDLQSVDRKDLISGLRFYLSRSTDSEAQTETIELGETESLQSAIKGLQDGDQVPFSRIKQVHLAFMDNKALPISQTLSFWPFSKATQENHLLKKGEPFYQNKLRIEMGASITSYLLYSIMQSVAQVTFSVVKQVNEEQNLTPSFYIDLLNIKKESQKGILDKSASFSDSYATQKNQVQFYSRRNTMLPELTYNRCPKRFLFSFMLQQRPDFTSDFHHTFIYRNLLQLYRWNKGGSFKKNMDFSDVNQEIDTWFPQWTQTKKDMLRYDSESPRRAKDNRYKEIYTHKLSYGAHEYSTDQRYLALFGDKSEGDIKESKNLEFSYSGKHCKFCPFTNQCKDSQLNN